MLTLHPAIPNNILVLDRHESFPAYRQAYGNRLVDHYENNGAILIPHVPIAFDLEFFAALQWPDLFKKVGTLAGLDDPIFKREGDRLSTDPMHPLNMIYGERTDMAAYIQSQIAMFNARLTEGLQALFPAYGLVERPSITWRLTPNPGEPPHLDSFHGGDPFPDRYKRCHRLKAFVNLDSIPRVWRVFLDLPRTLSALSGLLPRRLPADVNVLNGILNHTRLLDAIPGHEIKFPQMSAIVANGETLAHQIVFGRRMVAFEGLCEFSDMRDPARHSYACVRRWLQAAGLEPDDDPNPRVAKYVSGPVAAF